MPERQMDFAALRTLVGFDAYDRLLDTYVAPLGHSRPLTRT